MRNSSKTLTWKSNRNRAFGGIAFKISEISVISFFGSLNTADLMWYFSLALDHLAAFQQSISPPNLPALKQHQFQFLFRFPAKYEQEWIRRFHNNGWPFDNADFHIDEHLELLHYYYDLVDIQAVLLVYSLPFDLLKHMRTIHNDKLFTRQLTTNRKSFVCQNMEWLWKWTSNKTQLITSLKALRKVETLRCVCFGINVSRYSLTC
jgi:hypothetical protein